MKDIIMLSVSCLRYRYTYPYGEIEITVEFGGRLNKLCQDGGHIC